MDLYVIKNCELFVLGFSLHAPGPWSHTHQKSV